MKIQKTCSVCGKAYLAYSYEKFFCSGKCYHQSKKGQRWGGALNKGKKLGAYNRDRVNRMAEGKKEAHLQKAYDHPEYLRIDEARELLKEGYPTKLCQLARALGYNKLKTSHRYFADVCYVLFEKEKLELCKKDIPFAIASFNLKQVRWFKDLLKTCKSWEDFEERFLADCDKLNIYRSAGCASAIIKFVQETNFTTNALTRNLDLNRTVKGYSTEKCFRKVLQSLDIDFKEQVVLRSKEGKLFRPDFIIDNKIIVEINGDYWHGYGKDLRELPDKVRNRVLQDYRKYSFYEQEGFKYLIIWEHELQEEATIIRNIKEILQYENLYRNII